jgi:sugar (pentulose or hexulose) kinase
MTTKGYPGKGYLGIDAGTQGLSVIFTSESLDVLATGEGDYDMVPGLDEGCYEQRPDDWEAALGAAMSDLRSKLAEQNVEMDVAAIGISAQMHGEVLADAEGNSLGPARLWCDSRNDEEGNELTERFGVKMPKRITAARWLWTLRNQPERAPQVAHITTPAGWISYRLTGEWTLGIGDAAGMFPIDQATLDYDAERLGSFDTLVADSGARPLAELLPAVRKAGESAGNLNAAGAEMLGLAEGIPVAPAEGDQPAALAGSLIGAAGMVSISFGTSVCASSVGDRAFEGVHVAVDHFCAADGKPINMVWIRNGTTFMNTVVEMFGLALGGNRSAGFAAVMPLLLEADDDCGGLLALPFMDDEPGLGVDRGGTALLVGLNGDNATPGNVAKAALLATCFNLRMGSDVLDAQGYPRSEIILSGGLTKTPQLGQVVADVFHTPVVILASGEEGTAWGAALMAKYRTECLAGNGAGAGAGNGGASRGGDWSSFLLRHAATGATRFEPNATAAAAYDTVYRRYRGLMDVQGQLDKAVGG